MYCWLCMNIFHTTEYYSFSVGDLCPVNIAALIHNVSHQIVGNSNFHRISKTLQKAAARVSHNNAGLQCESEQGINQLQYVYQSANHSSVGTKVYKFLRGIIFFLLD